MNFMDELLAEVEEKEERRKLELDRLRADQLLMAIIKLEKRTDEINELADSEIKLIEEYRETELTKVQKKVSWLSWNLEQFIRTSTEKTINLPHGTLKMRLGRDKLSIIEIQKFLKDPANHKLLRVIPETYEPDISAIKGYIEMTGHIPEGVDLKPAEPKFSYTTIRSNNGNEKQQRTNENRAATESADKTAVVEE